MRGSQGDHVHMQDKATQAQRSSLVVDIQVLRTGRRNCKATIAMAERVAKGKAIDDKIVVDSGEPGRWLAMLHDNVRTFGRVFNAVAPGAALGGVLCRQGDAR
jgi:hypothetical protein